MLEYEKQVLTALHKKDGQTTDQLVASGVKEATVNYAVATLAEQGLVSVEESAKPEITLDKEGDEYLKNGLPERRLLEATNGRDTAVKELMKRVDGNVFRIGSTWLIKLGMAQIRSGVIVLTDKGRKALQEQMPQECALDMVSKCGDVTQFKDEISELSKRGKVLLIKERKTRVIRLTAAGKSLLSKGLPTETEVSQLTGEMIVTGSWQKKRLREYDVAKPVKPAYGGRRHFVDQAMDYCRKIWLEMGFKEMDGPIIDTSFWMFDALFVPQDHPAREMQDTFFIEPAKGELPDDDIVNRVKKAHESGVEGSLGWRYKWNEEEAKKLVLRPHTTILSAQTLHALKTEELPVKYFSVGRCFRNETMDWSHLFEFNQTEGIVADENANLRHMIGYLKRLCEKLGYPKVRFRPSYFPYTEPSLEFDVFHPVRKKWVELGGAGIFRPEVVEPLIGRDVPVLAWGPGFDRLMTEYYKITDIRDIYKNDVQQLRNARHWML